MRIQSWRAIIKKKMTMKKNNLSHKVKTTRNRTLIKCNLNNKIAISTKHWLIMSRMRKESLVAKKLGHRKIRQDIAEMQVVKRMVKVNSRVS